MQLAFRIFEMTGDRLAFLPSHQQWRREQYWHTKKLPDDLAEHREQVLETAYAAEQPPTFLMINHALGGGTGQHVEELARELKQQGIRTLVMQWHVKGHFRIVPVRLADSEPLFFHWPEELGVLAQLRERLNIQHVHLHHTMDFPSDFLDQFRAFMQRMQLPYDYTVHDYFSICPRFTLFDETVRGYCGEPSDVRKCDACVHMTGSAAGRDVDVRRWRHDYAQMMIEARKVFVPSTDVQTRMRRYAMAAAIDMKPHAEEQREIVPVAARYRSGETLRIVIIGGIAPHKGSKVILDCAEDALARRLPIHFTLIGYSDIDYKLKRLSNVNVTGRFKHEDLPQMLKGGEFHACFLPSVIPETYNYALSEAWRAGLYTACFDIGAIAARVKEAGFGHVMPLEYYFQPEKVNGALLSMPILELFKPEKLVPHFHHYPNVLKDYYEL